MCEFASWIEVEGKPFYLTKQDLKGKKFARFKKENSGWQDDICGHGAIEWFYPELKGKGLHRECVDFSTPAGFPKELVDDIKAGNMQGIGVALELLNDKGRKEYLKIEQFAWEKYLKIQQSTWEEYYKITQSAFWKIFAQKKYYNKEWK